MKIFLLSLIFVAGVLFASSAFGQVCPGATTPLKPMGYQQITVSNSAVGLTLPTKGGVFVVAVLTVENNAIRYRDDGVAPTAAVGMPVAVNNSIVLCGTSATAFRAIRQGSDAIANVSYYGF